MNKNLDLEYKHEWLQKMADVCEASSTIDSTLFDKYEVKRGLRDLNGQGVLTGLTEISEIRSYTVIDHDMVPCEGNCIIRELISKRLSMDFCRKNVSAMKKWYIFCSLVNCRQRASWRI